jgi:Mrp family chromosome partitioning ATPase
LPVLSVIPWLPERQWQTYRKRKTLEVLSAPSDSEIVKSYQSLALNLKLQRNATGKNALAVSALFDESGQSFILANLALCLAQSGERVVLIDTNLKQPRLHQLFGHGLSYEHGLTEVINSLAEYSSKRQNSTPQELLPLVQSNLFPSGIHPQLLYLNAGVVLDNTFEFLNSKGFSALVSTLKQHYDWVLFDAPPLLDDLDTSVLLAYLDGLLLCVERDSDEEQLRQARQKVHRMNSNIIGCILRGE